MVTLDGIRLTGLLRKSPANVGLFYCADRHDHRVTGIAGPRAWIVRTGSIDPRRERLTRRRNRRMRWSAAKRDAIEEQEPAAESQRDELLACHHSSRQLLVAERRESQ